MEEISIRQDSEQVTSKNNQHAQYEKINKLKEEANVIRTMRNGRRMFWPHNFRVKVKRVLQGGTSFGKLSKLLAISQQTIRNWCPRDTKLQRATPAFRELNIIPQPIQTLSICSPKGYEVKGLLIDNIYELIKRELL